MGQRAKRLLIPYFVLSLIGILPKYIFSSVLNDSLQLDAMSLTRAFLVPRENIWGHFWFLPMIFFMGVIAYIIEKHIIIKVNKSWGWGIMTLLLLACSVIYQPNDAMKWFGINDLVLYGWSYALGVVTYYMLGNLKEKVHLGSWKTVTVCLMGGDFLINFHSKGRPR